MREDSAMDTPDVRSMAQEAGDHPALENAARLGYAVNGVLHLLIGWLGLQLAWGLGGGGGSADQSGALRSLAETSVGRVVLWVGVVGFLGLGIWQASEAVIGRGKTSDRVKAVAKALLYLFLAFSSFSYAKGTGGESSSKQSVDATASLMKQPAGRALVVAVGLVVVGVGVYHVVKGWKRTFLRDLVGHPGDLAVKAGRLGYIAKGVALAVVGALFVLAGVRGAANEATGLDGALRTLLGVPYGKVLLTLVALGFAAFAVYSFARARYARV